MTRDVDELSRLLLQRLVAQTALCDLHWLLDGERATRGDELRSELAAHVKASARRSELLRTRFSADERTAAQAAVERRASEHVRLYVADTLADQLSPCLLRVLRALNVAIDAKRAAVMDPEATV